MTPVGPTHFAVVGAVVFLAGLFGVVSHRNGLATTISTALMVMAASLGLGGFAATDGGAEGGALALAALVGTTAMALVTVASLLLLWRREGDIEGAGSGREGPRA